MGLDISVLEDVVEDHRLRVAFLLELQECRCTPFAYSHAYLASETSEHLQGFVAYLVGSALGGDVAESFRTATIAP